MARSQNSQDRTKRLLEALSDGRFHSGEELGIYLSTTRAGVWKQLQRLRDLGVEVDAVRGRGYRLAAPVELLDAARITEGLSDSLRETLGDVSVVLATASTNQDLLARARQGGGSEVLLAEMQTAGRGRWGRRWHSPFGSNLYLSLLWPLQLGKGAQGLSIALGAAIADALNSLGADVRVKWPNDLLAQGGKLGGILLEVVGDPHGACRLVAGIGLNINLPAAARASIDQAVSDLRTAVQGQVPGRNEVAAVLIEALAKALETFEGQGLTPFIDTWNRYDALAGQRVTLDLGTESQVGRVLGVDEHGQLLIDDGRRTRAFASGEARIRKDDLPA